MQQWSCAATPIHDPGSTSLLGVLDITGSDDIAVPQTMAMVRAAARMAEAELAREKLTRHGAGSEPGAVHCTWSSSPSGATTPCSRSATATGAEHRLRLSPRHSEILLLLASAPRGLSGDELAVLVYEDDGASSTLRAELNRLRSLLGDDVLASRPYRLAGSITGDWLALEAQLAAGDLRAAMRGYRGPILPRSTAPGVVRLREQLHMSLREARPSQRAGRPDVDLDPIVVGRGRLRDVARPAGGTRRVLARCSRWSTGSSARLDRDLASVGATSSQRPASYGVSPITTTLVGSPT